MVLSIPFSIGISFTNMMSMERGRSLSYSIIAVDISAKFSLAGLVFS